MLEKKYKTIDLVKPGGYTDQDWKNLSEYLTLRNYLPYTLPDSNNDSNSIRTIDNENNNKTGCLG